MIGKIVGIEENIVTLKLTIDLDTVPALLNLYVVMEDEDKTCVGEIIDIKDEVGS